MHGNMIPGRLSHQPLNIQPQLSGPIFAPVSISQRRLQNINCIFKPSPNSGGLYLGDIISIVKSQHLQHHQIRAVLSCMAENLPNTLPVIAHKVLPIKDTLQYPICQHFHESIVWIQEKRKQKLNVLVHCHAGVSRSATLVIVYLMATQKWTPFQAFQFVRHERERIKPNAGFWKQINDFHLFLQQQQENLLTQSMLVPVNTRPSVEVSSHAPMKMSSEANLPKRFTSLEPKDQIIEKKPQKVTRRRKIFENLQFQKGFASRSRKQQILSEYYRPQSKSTMKPPPSHIHHSSVLAQDPFSQNKSALYVRPAANLQPTPKPGLQPTSPFQVYNNRPF